MRTDRRTRTRSPEVAGLRAPASESRLIDAIDRVENAFAEPKRRRGDADEDVAETERRPRDAEEESR